jgi:hypothetical protein
LTTRFNAATNCVFSSQIFQILDGFSTLMLEDLMVVFFSCFSPPMS